MFSHPRLLAVFSSSLAISVCALALDVVRAQTPPPAPRRVTVTSDEHLNLNPTLSGDGRRLVFESTADLAHAGEHAHLRLITAELASDPPSFAQAAAARAPAAALSHDGARIAFASKDDPLGSNPDGNSEIFLFDNSGLRQITDTLPRHVSRRVEDGNFQPSLTNDGQLIAFASNRDLTGLNPDANFEIFLFDVAAQSCLQLTATAGIIGAVDARISGDGSRIAVIRDDGVAGESESTLRQLLVYEFAGRAFRIVAADVADIRFTYGRAISNDGSRIVYSARTAPQTTQVFLADVRHNLLRQLTALRSRTVDVPLHPTISGDGTRVAFATRRSVIGGNSDQSVELYVYDIPSGTFLRITDVVPATAATTATTTPVVSSLDDSGSLVAFNFPRVLSNPALTSEVTVSSEIYTAQVPARQPFSLDVRIVNGAAPNKNISAPAVLAPNSIAIAFGTNLALAIREAVASPDNSFPRELAGTSVMINGRRAQIFYVSPTQVNFHIPPEIEVSGAAQVVVRNPDGFEIRGNLTTARAAPGIFTQNGDGTGEVLALDALSLRRGPFSVTDDEGNARRILLFGTGLSHDHPLSVMISDHPRAVAATVAPVPGLPGLDQLHLALPHSLRGAGQVPLVVVQPAAAGQASNRVFITLTAGGGAPRPASIELAPSSALIPSGGVMQFRARLSDALGEEITDAPVSYQSGDSSIATIDHGGRARGVRPGRVEIRAASGNHSATAELRVLPRTLVINEVLADPPDGMAGDANGDGSRSGSDDEFIELINASGHPLDVSGWTIQTRALNNTTENTRHTFAPATVLPADDAIVIFGGGDFDSHNPRFGGTRTAAASSGSLSLGNAGLVIIICDANGNFVTEVSYGMPGDTFGGDAVNQSLTRSPDVTGNFARHTAVDGAAGRRFSPGTNLDNSFFVPRPGRLTSLILESIAGTLFVGQTIQLTARAFDQYARSMDGVEVVFASSDVNIIFVGTGVATGADFATARATGRGVGSAHISAIGAADGVSLHSNQIRIDVKTAPPRLTRIEVVPRAASINRGRSMRFAAKAFDSNNQLVTDAMFTWASSNEAAAVIDEGGLAGGSGIGTTIITATASDGVGGMISGSASLTIQIPLVINEILADPPGSVATHLQGDANLDGTRDGSEDEFVELLNASDETLDVSGVVIADSAQNRYTFPPGTLLAAGQPAVIFGGGRIPSPLSAGNRQFGGAFVFSAAPSALNLNNDRDTVIVKLPLRAASEVIIASQSYSDGGGAAAAGGVMAASDQSLTRSPDAATAHPGGSFMPHTNATHSADRPFSPGTRVDGTPFGSPPITRLVLLPASAVVAVGATQTFHARAFALVAGAEIELHDLSVSWSSSDMTRATVSPSPIDVDGAAGASSAAVVVTALRSGDVVIRARIGGADTSSALLISAPAQIAAGQVIINEAVVAIDAGNVQARDFVELYNPTGAAIDISGLIISFRQSGSGSSGGLLRVALPGAVGSRTTIIHPRDYFLIANGPQAYGVAADYDAGATNPPHGFNLNNTTGGIRIGLDGVQLDGLTYQGGSAAPPPAFTAFGEGAVFTFTGGTTNDLIRTPNASDTDNNARDFRRNGAAARITPKTANPLLP